MAPGDPTSLDRPDATRTPGTALARTLRVDPARVRWRCDPETLGFADTREVPPREGIIGQEDAIDALRFGLEVHAPGQHVFVRGLTGTGRFTVVQHLLSQTRPTCPVARDRCYVHDFEAPDRPRLISLPRGRARAFRDRIDQLVGFLAEQLVPALTSEEMRARRKALDEALQKALQEQSEAFEARLAEVGLGLVSMRTPQGSQPAIVPLVEGKPVPPEQFEERIADGTVSEERAQEVRAALADQREAFEELGRTLTELRETHGEELHELYAGEARRLLDAQVREIRAAFPGEDVGAFLHGVVEDVIGRRLRSLSNGEEQEAAAVLQLYRVNPIVSHEGDDVPIVIENTPTVQNLLGGVDRVVLPNGGVHSDHTMIRAGSMLRAEGGYLVLDARDVLSEPGAWKVLVRTLRTGKLEVVPHDLGLFGAGSLLKPEPVEVNVKVVLLGDPGLYYALDAQDPDFPQLFKVLADFSDELPRDEATIAAYAGWASALARAESLPPFGRDAVAVLCEHGARIAGRNDRLTARFGRLGDIAREAAFLSARHDPGQPLTTAEHVREAIRRGRHRADLPSRRFRERIADGTLRIQVRGSEIGQVNGLAVMQAGPLTFGFPARLTATVGVGTRGLVDIERESSLSGRIHTKGFHILRGLLEHLLRLEHPLALHASLAFEQSYGGVDGDSASGAEACCLLSALTGVPLRQDLAMTGAIDQFGHIQPIGGASEKVEGFFDACQDQGLTGEQGVILPRANVVHLQLREEVAAAVAEGRFHVYAVDTLQQALELFTGTPAGVRNDEGAYPEDSLLGRAVRAAHTYWRKATARPGDDGEG